MKNYRSIYCTEASIEGLKCVGGMKVWLHMFSDRIVNDSELCTSCSDYFIPTETVPGTLGMRVYAGHREPLWKQW